MAATRGSGGPAGETDLARLLAAMRPEVVPGVFVVVSVDRPLEVPAAAMVREREGLAYVLERHVADELGLAYDYEAGWITLRVHSSLHAVGLTAAVSTALAAAGLSCNVLAGAFHDHLLVPYASTADAVDVLVRLSAGAG